jgi:type III secretion system FlhB-like substrate exporter
MDLPEKQEIPVAVGVKYTMGDPAPIVISKGRGVLAKKIMELAEKYDVPMVKEADLANALVELPEGLWIPEEYFTILSNVLASIYKVQGRL